jgi:hypothetical protein
MNWTRFILAAIGGYIVLVAVGALWHLVIFPAAYADVMKTMQAALVGIFVQDALRALVLAYVYPIGYHGGSAWMEGLKFGVLMGLLAGFTAGIYLGIVGQPMNMVWIELVFLVIQGALNGIAVGWIYGAHAAQAK